MKKRIITAIVGISTVLLLIFFSYTFPFVMNVALAFISVFCTYEMCNSLALDKNYVFFIPSLLFSASLPLIPSQSVWEILCFIYTVLVFAGMIVCYSKIKFKDIITAYGIIVLISIALGSMIMLRDYGETDGVFYLVLPLVLAWCADAGAYFIGRTLGKRKLCPHISPKKTIAGAVGGIIFGTIGVVICCLIFQYLVLPSNSQINYFIVIVMSLIGSILSMVGDLSFSIIKRTSHIKDFGDVMPGHGGFLDRFDSVIFVAPLIYITVLYLPFV